LDDFLANLQNHIENDQDYNYYYKLIAERPNKKVDYVVGSFRVAANIEHLLELALPRSSRVRLVPLGYLATLAEGIDKDPIIILVSSTQTVALCMESGEIHDIRVFQFSIDRCLEQLRRDHFSENQARQFMEIDFSFQTYHSKDRILSLKIEVDQFLEDLKRLFLSRLKSPKQPIWIAADAFSHHDAEAAIQALTTNPVSLLSEKDWVRDGAARWSQNQERFLHVPHKKLSLKMPTLKDGKKFAGPLVVLVLALILLGYFSLQRHLTTQITRLAQSRDALMLVRSQWLDKMNTIPEASKALTKMEKMREQIQMLKKGQSL
jgi:hypothetical protein